MWRPLVLCLLVACSESHVDETSLGDATFSNVCSRCHGQNGTGGIPTGGIRPRDLSDPAWQASLGDGQLEVIVRIGRGSMPAFQKALSADQIRAVVGKVRRLQRKTP